jgi:hypothetical protein
MHDIRAGRGKEGVGARNTRHGVGALRGFAVVMLGQAFDLLGVKDGVALHEGDRPLGILAAFGYLGADDLVGIDDKAPAFALANIGFQLKRLLEGHPHRRGVTFVDGLGPQHQDIDALIGNAICAERARNARFPVPGAPWFQPRPDAALKVGHDPVGDGATSRCASGQRGSLA